MPASAFAPNLEQLGRVVVADDAPHIGRVAGVPGVDQPFQFLVVADKGVGFVDQQCWFPQFDGAKQERRRRVRRRQGTGNQLGEDGQQ